VGTTSITVMALTGPALWVAVGGVCLLVLGVAAVRVVPVDQLAVVRRFGRVVRVAGPGVVVHMPGLDQVTCVPRFPVHCPLVVHAMTRDGVQVRLIAAAVCRIVDPARSAGPPDPLCAPANAVEAALAHWVGQTDLAELLQARAEAEAQLPDQVSEMTAEWGVEVLEVEVSDIETRLTADVLRLVDEPRRNHPGHR